MLRVGVVTSLLWVGACSGTMVGGEGGDGGEAPAPSSPPPVSGPQACGTYVSTWCGHSIGCYVEVGRLREADRKHNVDQCTKAVVDSLPCSAVGTVGASYPQCLADIKTVPCSKFDVPPEQFWTLGQPGSCDAALAF